jgi:hypothetical protein
MSALVCKRSALFILCILGVCNRKVRETQTFMLVCIISACSLHRYALSVYKVCIFQNSVFIPGKHTVLMQTMCKTRADFADLVQTFADLLQTFF